MARRIKPGQNYGDRLLKLIPSEIVAAYLAVQGIVPEESRGWALAAVSAFLLVLTPVYLRRYQKVHSRGQLVLSSGALLVWIYSLGGPFREWGLYQPWLGSVLLVMWTLLVPVCTGSGYLDYSEKKI